MAATACSIARISISRDFGSSLGVAIVLPYVAACCPVVAAPQRLCGISILKWNFYIDQSACEAHTVYECAVFLALPSANTVRLSVILRFVGSSCLLTVPLLS